MNEDPQREQRNKVYERLRRRPDKAVNETHLSFGRGKAHSRRRGGVGSSGHTGVGSEGTAGTESAILAGLRGERRKPCGRRSRVLSRDEKTGVGRGLLVRTFDGDVGDAREEKGKEERDE